MKYGCKLESKEALCSRGDLEAEFLSAPIETPTKAHPIAKVEEIDEMVDPSAWGVNEVYVQFNSRNLIEFEEWALNEDSDVGVPEFIDRLKEKLEFARPTDLNCVFFEFTEPREMTGHEFRVYVELAKEYSDIITQPIQLPLIRALRGLLSDVDLPEGESLPDNVYRSYKNGIRTFCEETKGVNYPLMGVIPLFPNHFNRMNDHIQIYDEDQYDILGLCIDFRGRRPTKGADDGNFKALKKFVGTMGDRRTFEDYLLYALNPLSYSKHPSLDCHTPEDFILAALGFDIIGETHFGGGSSDAVKSLNLFEAQDTIYQSIEIAKLRSSFPRSGLKPEYFEESESRALRLTRLFCSEQIEFGLQDFRRAIDNGEEFAYLRNARGIIPDRLENIKSLANHYEGGSSKGPTEFHA